MSDLDQASVVIASLPRDFYDLSQAVERRSGVPDGPSPPGRPTSRPPMNLLIDAIRTHIVYTAAIWEEVVRNHEKLTERRPGSMREGPSIVLSATILAPRADVFAALPATVGYFNGVEHGPVSRRGVDGVRRLLGLHKLARTAVGLTEVTYRLPGECANRHCRAQTLRRAVGTDTVWCDTCQQRWTYDDYRRYTSLMTLMYPVTDANITR